MIRMKSAAAGLVVVAVVSVATMATYAYSTYGRWAVTPVVFYVNPANADVPTSSAEAALQAAMQVWNDQSGSSFRFSYGGRVNDTSTGNDGRSVVIFRNEANGGTLASTYSWSSNGSLVDSDIIFWDGGFTFFAGTTGCSSGAYIEDVGAHEFGHALGLGHSDRTDATMYPTYGWCSQAWRTLSADDVTAAQSLYPAGSGSSAPEAPTQLQASTNAGSPTSSLVLSWVDNATNESGYRVQRSTDGANFTQVAQLGPAQSYTDSGLAPGTRYYYRVAAFNNQGTSAFSNASWADTQVPTVTNTAPSVSISSPTNGSSHAQGAAVTFSGSANDSQDGSLTSSLQWTSNIDGALGTGSGFSRTLSAGSHVITARATDSGGLSSSSQTSVTVTSASSSDPFLSARAYKVKGLQRTDLSWKNVAASIVDVYRNDVKVATTANDGMHTDAINRKGAGSYTYRVCAAGTATCTNAASASF